MGYEDVQKLIFLLLNGMNCLNGMNLKIRKTLVSVWANDLWLEDTVKG
jgi:hypothetical protein